MKTPRVYENFISFYVRISSNNSVYVDFIQAHTYHPSIPFIAHKKLTNVTTPVPHNSVRKSVIGNTLDRIHYKPRSLQSYDPMEDFLNERSVTVSSIVKEKL